MTDKTELEISRGEEAARLLANPLYVESFDAVEQELMEQWKNSPARDEAGREKLWLSLKLLHRTRAQLEQVMQTGHVARETLASKIGQAFRRTF